MRSKERRKRQSEGRTVDDEEREKKKKEGGGSWWVGDLFVRDCDKYDAYIAMVSESRGGH